MVQCVKKSGIIIQALAIFLLCLFGTSPTVHADIVNDAQGLSDNLYYRIRFGDSNFYLTAGSPSTNPSNGTYLTIQNRIPLNSSNYNANNQIFKLDILSNGCYRLSPLSASTYAIGISNLTDVNTIGTKVVLTNNSTNSKLRITKGSNGRFLISPYTSSSNIGMMYYSPAAGEKCFLRDTSTFTAYSMVFEPAYAGNFSYSHMYLADDNITTSMAYIQSTWPQLGYTSSSVYLPTQYQFINKVNNSRVLAFTVHGVTGEFVAMDENSTVMFAYYSNGSPNSSLCPNIADDQSLWGGKDYVMIDSCYSAASNNDYIGIAQAIYNHGNRCVTGFKNEVVDTSLYLQRMTLAAYADHVTELRPSIANLQDEVYSTYTVYQRYLSSCPANPNNLTNFGDTSVKLDMAI